MDVALLKHLALTALDEPVYGSPLFPPSKYYRFFKLLAQELQPGLSVELGVCGGGGSLHLALGNPDGQVIGIDKAYDHPEQLKHISERCKNFLFIEGDSVKVASNISYVYGKVDILFIDTVHTKKQSMAEFTTWQPFLSDDAIVCMDDLFRPGMTEAFYELPGEKVEFNFLKSGERNPGGGEQEGGFGVIYNIGRV